MKEGRGGKGDFNFEKQNETSEFIRLEFTSEISLRIEKERKQNGRGVKY